MKNKTTIFVVYEESSLLNLLSIFASGLCIWNHRNPKKKTMLSEKLCLFWHIQKPICISLIINGTCDIDDWYFSDQGFSKICVIQYIGNKYFLWEIQVLTENVTSTTLELTSQTSTRLIKQFYSGNVLFFTLRFFPVSQRSKHKQGFTESAKRRSKDK